MSKEEKRTRKNKTNRKYKKSPKGKARIKEYYGKNKEEVKANSKKNYKKNKDKILKRHKKYEQRPEVKAKKKEYNQRPEVKARVKEYKKKNKDKPEVKERERKYKKEYREKLREIENLRRKKLNLPLVNEGYTYENELKSIVKNLFPNYKVKKTRNAFSGWNLELDIYVPALKLAFEYNGEQHYEWIKFFQETEEKFKSLQYRDRCKKKLCKLFGITLITIKYDEDLSEQLVLTKLKRFKFPVMQRTI